MCPHISGRLDARVDGNLGDAGNSQLQGGILMTVLAHFLEKLHLGVVEDPYTNRRWVLTETVTVCPACRSLHSLRHERAEILCLECAWHTRVLEPASAA